MPHFLIIILIPFYMTSANASQPNLYFTYSRINDFQCQKLSGFDVPDAWVTEVKQRLTEFQKTWNKEATPLFKQLFELTGQSFSHNEMRVTLSVCKTISMSNPFVVNVRRYLKGFTPDKLPAPMYAFVSTTFHEFIHNYLVENFDSENSHFIKKYKNETVRVRSHLHLMALQKVIYRHLRRTELLTWMDLNYKRMGGAYARAWKIVSQLEDEHAFIEDLKDNLKQNRPIGTAL